NFQKQYESAKNTPKSIRHKWKIYKLAYGLLAIYGLRPREIVNKPDFNWLLSSDNIRNTFKVHADNKTGYREVVPFVLEWVDLFDIKNEENIRLFQETMVGCTTSRELHLKVGLISSNFVRSKIPFQPYDLRHACAIRAHLQGVPIKAASDNLGHTVEMHTKVYQHWFGFDNRVKAFNQAREEQNELQRAYDEIANLRNKVAKLELENTKLRLTYTTN
ncbi:MAG: site-specific integrase, partial [Cyanobacteria bacterium J06628_3]